MKLAVKAAGLGKAYLSSHLSGRILQSKDICILDTAMGSENVGDEIIMEACNHVIDSLGYTQSILHIPTHYHTEESESLQGFAKILCGTNVIYKNMRGQRQWALPRNIASYANTCLLGVGMSDVGIEDNASLYSKLFFKSLLSANFMHSVRDERTKAFFESIGIKNVLNTSCPTTWTLTPDRCATIPRAKGRVVVSTITDYNFDADHDFSMLDTLKACYETVYIWLQGSHDLDWCLKDYDGLSECILIPGKLSFFDDLLDVPGIDYVGTRLHAGIRAMNKGVRSLIISIDNRARSMADDIKLPILDRGEIERLEEVLSGGIDADISLPTEHIDAWKAQFIRKDR